MRADVHPVRFRYPEADVNSISVVGSFNHRDPSAHPLIYRDGDWRITVVLPAGTYRTPSSLEAGSSLIRI